MRMDGFTQALLTLIAAALTVIAMTPLLHPASSHAQQVSEYKVVELRQRLWPYRQTEAILNGLAKDGWSIAYGWGDLVVMKR